jgi:hypothetical protein
VDDFGIRELTAAQPDDLYELITERAGRSLILSSNRNVEIIFIGRIRPDTGGVFRTAIDRPVIDPDAKSVVVNVF